LHILISNDDGYLARGLRVLAESLRQFAEVTVVAPDRNRSGASNSLTLDTPLRVERVADDVLYGLETVEKAGDDYGVVVAPDGAIDQGATEKLRAGA